MKKKIIILTSIFFAFILYLAPASLIEKNFPQQNQLNASGFTGSLWSGEIAQVNTPTMKFDDVKFSINPFAFFLAKLSVDLDMPSKSPISGDLNLSLGSDYANSFTINNANIELKASQLENYLPVNDVELKGRISSSDLMLNIINRKPTEAEGFINWNDAEVVFLNQSWPLGNFIVNVHTDSVKNEIIGVFEKTQNALGLEGKVTLMENGTLEFIGSIDTNTDQRLYNTVALFSNGNPANNRLPLKIRQKIF